MNRPSISLIVPVRNGGIAFHRCVAGWSKTAGPDVEVIVVCDGDDSGRAAEACGARVLRLPVCGGPARARNAGARAARAEILFFLDADVLLASNALEKAAAAFEGDFGLAALIGSYDDAPGAGNFLSQYRNLLHHYVHQQAREEAGTFWGGCSAIRRSVFHAVGGFDERYARPSIEDIELGYRLSKAGYRIRMCKDIQGKHLKKWTPVSLLRTDLFDRAAPWTELILRDRRAANDLNLNAVSRASTVLVLAFLVLLISAVGRIDCLAFAGAAAVSLLILNLPIYRFFAAKRGVGFAIKTIPWHWFYYFYSGLGFGLGTARYLMRSVPTATQIEKRGEYGEFE